MMDFPSYAVPGKYSTCQQRNSADALCFPEIEIIDR